MIRIRERVICNYIGLAHFNNKTYNENILWKHNTKFTGCIYGLQQFLPDSIPPESDIYMIDMNNDTNKIVGIGLVKKVNIPENRTRVYDNEEFNRYIISPLWS